MNDSGAGAHRCRPRAQADALDKELARRLNDWMAGADRDTDPAGPITPVIWEALAWSVLAIVALLAAGFAVR